MQQWWDDLSLKQKLVYSATAMTSGGATIGGLTAKQTLAGIGVGALAGFGLWGLVAIWQIKKAADRLPLVPTPLLG